MEHKWVSFASQCSFFTAEARIERCFPWEGEEEGRIVVLEEGLPETEKGMLVRRREACIAIKEGGREREEQREEDKRAVGWGGGGNGEGVETGKPSKIHALGRDFPSLLSWFLTSKAGNILKLDLCNSVVFLL